MFFITKKKKISKCKMDFFVINLTLIASFGLFLIRSILISPKNEILKIQSNDEENKDAQTSSLQTNENEIQQTTTEESPSIEPHRKVFSYCYRGNIFFLQIHYFIIFTQNQTNMKELEKSQMNWLKHF